MGFRLWRRVKLGPGITFNLSKSGGSLSFGPRGAKFTTGLSGQRATIGIPGTGLFYTKKLSTKKAGRGKKTSYDVPEDSSASSEHRLTLGFFKRLVTPDDEKAFVDGCRELALGNEDAAFYNLEQAVHLADGAYLAGFYALKKEMFGKAVDYLTQAADNHRRLNRYFPKYGISAVVSFPITGEIFASISPNLRGVLLGLVEAYQRQKRWQDAIACLERLRRLEPDDPVVKLSLAELVLDFWPNDKNTCQKVVRLLKDIENESPIHTALMLYKAIALRRLGLATAARDTLTAALRRKKDRSAELINALRYQRALVYEDLGQTARARGELEKIYAEMPDFEDVADRLHLTH